MLLGAVGDGSLPHPESEQTEDELQEEIAKVSWAGWQLCDGSLWWPQPCSQQVTHGCLFSPFTTWRCIGSWLSVD